MHTKLTFLEDLPLYDEEKPFRFVGFPNLPSEWQSNCTYVDKKVVVSDARGREKEFVLDDYGFKFIKHKSSCDLNMSEFDITGKNEQNLAAYLEESLRLAQKELGVERVICFDWRIRKNLDKPVVIPADESENFRHYTIPPAANIHCEDLTEVDKVLPEKVEYTLFSKYRNYHKWYMLSDQQPDEAIFFVTWDSRNFDECSNVPPHGACLEIGKGSSSPRESIEVRLLVMSPVL
ncbi:hypothetical protein G7Y89_g4665 [Cudoniella acicularis]|uniref:Uncharacterized protein n=1 Tax=Cudoniella acicularis TaxID=354080 RepID=A0A8H4RNZ5_9HELO|nr:hypothetical protein G7Y89_g4665 [Cudoniella acicularis]